LGAAIEAQAEATIFTEASTHVEVPAKLRVHGVAGGETGQVFIEERLGTTLMTPPTALLGDMP
jgi:hypothetical protein